MKRRITIEVDDTVFPGALDGSRYIADTELGFVVSRVEREGIRGEAIENLKQFGVTVISDEQL